MPKAAFAYWSNPTALKIALEAHQTLLAPPEGLAWMWLWDDARHRREGGVVFESGADPTCAATYPAGRVFGPLGELRWRTRAGLIHALLITDAQTPDETPSGFEAARMLEEGIDETYRLWEDDDLRLPFGLEGLPVLQTGRWLGVRRYPSERGEAAFIRYTEVKP
jgi:hypothetical protein